MQLGRPEELQFIWMDRRMPVMDGLEATVQLRRRGDGREVKIAALTASVFEDEREEWFQAGIDGFVGKPFQENEIFDCMQDLLGVEYVYQEQPERLPPPLAVDLPTELSLLPEVVRTELADALVFGESDRLDETLRKVGDVSPGLADSLGSLIEEFDYSPILQALNAGGPH